MDRLGLQAGVTDRLVGLGLVEDASVVSVS